jgi:Cupin superfamily protein
VTGDLSESFGTGALAEPDRKSVRKASDLFKMAAWNFTSVLSPQPGDYFLRECLGKRTLVIPGEADKWKHVLSWADINEIITYSGITGPRFRLYDSGQEIPVDVYQIDGPNGYPRLRLAEINRKLQDGATMVIDSADSLSRTVSELCHGIEQELSVPVQANLFVTCSGRAVNGLLWNDYEMIVLQLSGSRLWRIYGPTSPLPTKYTPPLKPAGDPQWEQSVSGGDLLYVPRGCWYDGSADGTPEFHLRLMFRNATALDILYRLVDQQNAALAMRMDYPRFEDANNQSEFFHDDSDRVAPGLRKRWFVKWFSKRHARHL